MADVAAAVGQCIGGLFPVLWASVAHRVDHIKRLQDHIENLNREMGGLKTKCDDIEAQIREAKRQLREPKNEVKNWVAEVSRIEEKFNSIVAEFEQRRRCFNLNSCCPNYFSHYKLAKKAIRTAKVAAEFRGRGDFGEVAMCPSPERVVDMPTTSRHGQATSEETLWQLLHDHETGMVSVYGMGGVGKTTLLMTINNKLAGDRDFDKVIWITVSKDQDLKRIQMDIGDRLGLGLQQDESHEMRRVKILASLMHKRYVIILDDLWRTLNLNAVGIPKPNRQNRCKIILSTRFLGVSNGMEADRHIKVETLKIGEAWNLFHEKAGDVVLLQDIRSLAEEVVTECGGLPLAIITVGRAMRGKEKKELWLNAIRALKESAVPEIEGMEPNIFRSLKLSFDQLEECDIKLCFLYCALYPEDHIIDIHNLVRYWTMEGMICNTSNLEDTSNKGHAIIEKLKDTCLLEEEVRQVGYLNHKYVKMHDLLRDLAIWITSSSCSSSSSSSKDAPKLLVKAGMRLEEPPEEKIWEGVERISLISNEIKGLQLQPNCPGLVSLRLQENPLEIIPTSFFQFMPMLRVLDLTYTNIFSLPTSLSSLQNLNALMLNRCFRLKEIPAIGSLQQLQFLDLENCRCLEKLPQGIGELVNLKWLNLSHMMQLTTIPPNTISRLSRLEELHMQRTPIRWAKKGELEHASENNSTASLEEIATLKRLHVLAIVIEDSDSLAPNIFDSRQWSSLRRFRVVFGANADFIPSNHFQKEVYIRGGSFLPACKVVVSHAEYIQVKDCCGQLPISQLIGDAKSLRELRILYCPDLEYIIDTGAVGINIERMVLTRVPDLKTLFHEQVPYDSPSLHRLRSLSIGGAPQLRSLIFSNQVKHLDSLEELELDECGVEEIIKDGDNMLLRPVIALPKLRNLRLEYLSKLKCICTHPLAFTSLQEINAVVCPKLKKLPYCPSIQKLEGEKEWFEELEWEDDDDTKSLFATAFVEYIVGGDTMKGPLIVGEMKTRDNELARHAWYYLTYGYSRGRGALAQQ